MILKNESCYLDLDFRDIPYFEYGFVVVFEMNHDINHLFAGLKVKIFFYNQNFRKTNNFDFEQLIAYASHILFCKYTILNIL